MAASTTAPREAQDTHDWRARTARKHRRQQRIGAVDPAQYLARQSAGAGAVGRGKPFGQGSGLVQGRAFFDRGQQAQGAIARHVVGLIPGCLTA